MGWYLDVSKVITLETIAPTLLTHLKSDRSMYLRVNLIQEIGLLSVRSEDKQDLQNKIIVTLFGLFAEIERALISMRTKECLAAARVSGKRLGRPKGKLGTLKLDGR